MAITYDLTARNNILDNGCKYAYSSATLDIKDAGGVVLCTITLPTYGVAASGALSLPSSPQGTGLAAAGAGTTATQYTINLTGGGTESGTISTTAAGTGDLTIDDTNIKENGIVTLSTLTITQPGSAT